MQNGTTQSVMRQLRRLALRETEAMTDGQLLECFANERDEAAFAALVRRHGPMVYGVCRRVARHVQDAEDAFQATFLVLVHKAAVLRPRELVGHWLYGVAYRTALKARAGATRRKEHEKQVPAMPHTEAPPVAVDDWLPLLDREIQQLPEKYRIPIVLCDLEGRTRRDVARQLKLSDGTLTNRLASGRRMLARRLARHGVVLTTASLASALLTETASAVPGRLITAAVRSAIDESIPGAVSNSVAALSQGVLKTMLLQKLKVAALAVTVIGLIAVGAGVFSMPVVRAQQPATPSKPTPADPKLSPQQLQGAWLMVAASEAGIIQPQSRVEQEGKRWTFNAGKFLVTRTSQPGQVVEAEYTLDPTKSPCEFDYMIDDGGKKGKKVAATIWLMDDLMIVADNTATRTRPAGLNSQSGQRDRIMVFERDGGRPNGADSQYLARVSRQWRGNSPTTLENHYFTADKDAAKRARAILFILGGKEPGQAENLGLQLLQTYNPVANALDYYTNRALATGTFDLAFPLSKPQAPIAPLLFNNLNQFGQPAWAIGIDGSVRSTIELTPYSYFGRSEIQYLTSANVKPATTEDEKFLRRTMLDLVGSLPTPMELHYFVADKDPKKRDKVIDWLVKSEEHARHTAHKATSPSGGAAADPLDRLLDDLFVEGKSDGEMLNALTLAVLARFPTDSEKTFVTAQLANKPDHRAAWNDVLATLLKLPDAQQHIDGMNRRRSGK
jgi:RNA polymerase sigma factor (sigma-70 family)